MVKRGVQHLVDFEISIDTNIFTQQRRLIQTFYDEIGLFILDEDDATNNDNLMTLGLIQDVNLVLQNPVKSVISWSVAEVI